MSEKEEDLKDLAKEMAGMIHKNIVDVTNQFVIVQYYWEVMFSRSPSYCFFC